MNLPPLLELRELPEEVRELILEQLVQEASPDLCGRLYERCLQLLGSGNCGAGHPIWRQACERFGVRRTWAADWRATFQSLCRSLKTLRGSGTHSANRALRTFFSYVQGRAKEVDLNDELEALSYFALYQLFLLREAFLGLGAVDIKTPAALRNLKNALESGDVDAVKAAIGTGVNAGVRELSGFVYSLGLDLGGVFLGNTVEGHLEWIRLLLEAGVRTDAVMAGGTILRKAVISTALYGTSLSDFTQLVKLLLEHGVDPNYGGPWDPPLCALVKNAQVRFFNTLPFVGGGSVVHAFNQRSRLLLDHGADPTLPAHDGRTALTVANEWRDTNPDQRAFWDSYIEMLEGYARRD